MKADISKIGKDLLGLYGHINGDWKNSRRGILTIARKNAKYAPVAAKILDSKFHDECLVILVSNLRERSDANFFKLNPDLKPRLAVSQDLGDEGAGIRQLCEEDFYRFAFHIWCSLQFFMRSQITNETLAASQREGTPFLWQGHKAMLSAKLFSDGRGSSKYGIIQRTIKDPMRWREPTRSRITDLSNYSDAELAKLAILCLRETQNLVREYMFAKLRGISFENWQQARRQQRREFNSIRRKMNQRPEKKG